jgi:hypothetical protein
MSDYKYTVKVRDKEIKFRKWKIRDKKNFIEAFKANDGLKVQALVYDCIEDPNIALSDEEFKWVILNIRAKSIGETLSFDIYCDNCKKYFEKDEKIVDIHRPNFKPFGILKSGNIEIEMGNIPNKEYYEDAIQQCNTPEERTFVDFLYHIKKLNGSDAFTFDTLYEFVNELDIDVGEDIFKQWDAMKFSFDTVKEVRCPYCNTKQDIWYDELYGFFPENWFE